MAEVRRRVVSRQKIRVGHVEQDVIHRVVLGAVRWKIGTPVVFLTVRLQLQIVEELGAVLQKSFCGYHVSFL